MDLKIAMVTFDSNLNYRFHRIISLADFINDCRNQSVGFHHMQLNKSSFQVVQCFDNQSLLIYKWNNQEMSGLISDIQKPFKYPKYKQYWIGGDLLRHLISNLSYSLIYNYINSQQVLETGQFWDFK